MKKVLAILFAMIFVASTTGLCFAQAAPAAKPTQEKAAAPADKAEKKTEAKKTEAKKTEGKKKGEAKKGDAKKGEAKKAETEKKSEAKPASATEKK